MNRNLNVRNFGLRSRDATRALMTAYQMKGNGYASNATVQSALRTFTRFLKRATALRIYAKWNITM